MNTNPLSPFVQPSHHADIVTPLGERVGTMSLAGPILEIELDFAKNTLPSSPTGRHNRPRAKRISRMKRRAQPVLFDDMVEDSPVSDANSSTFTKNMGLPVHRWFRYSAGFSAEWAEQVIKEHLRPGGIRVFDPFAGSATTLLAAECQHTQSIGIDSHPFISRVARAKLEWRSDPDAYLDFVKQLRSKAQSLTPQVDGYPQLIYKCYDTDALASLDMLRQAFAQLQNGSPASELAWLTLVAILRKTSKAGTAQWQYILPRKQKRSPKDVFGAFDECVSQIHSDMKIGARVVGPRAHFQQSDARTCSGVADSSADLVVTSPPYPNNYDYADAVRLEMCFMREIGGWGDLQESVRKYLVRSCTQHVPERSVALDSVLKCPEVAPIAAELTSVCNELAEVRKTKGGKKTYHLMIACYFRDLAQVWQSLRRVCAKGSRVCFVIGDSAPYGVYVPVIPWLGSLAVAAGFKSYEFERTRDRNVKWKNRKHRVPLQEGRLWVQG